MGGTGRGQQGTDGETDGSEGGGADCHAEQNAETRLRKGEIGGDEPDGDRKAGSDQAMAAVMKSWNHMGRHTEQAHHGDGSRGVDRHIEVGATHAPEVGAP